MRDGKIDKYNDTVVNGCSPKAYTITPIVRMLQLDTKPGEELFYCFV